MSEKRLSLLSNGHVRYELKTPYRDGTTHVIFEPNSAHRAQVMPAKRGKGNKVRTADAPEASTPASARAAGGPPR